MMTLVKIRPGQKHIQKSLLDLIFDAFIVVDRLGNIVLLNEGYSRLLGGREVDFLGRHVTEVISPNTKLHLVAQGGPPIIDERLTVRGHEFVTRQIPIRADGKIIGAAGMAILSEWDQGSAASRIKDLADNPQNPWKSKYTIHDIIGEGAVTEGLRDQIRKAAAVSLPVHISGESGTGKELAAHAIHALSHRAKQPFVWFNCSTVSHELTESELFGYDAGAFTGANSAGAKGKFELAEAGTIFLDEIGDMALHTQATLLRVLQEREFVRVGGRLPIQMKARIICATNRDLSKLVEAGRFREDLFYRLDVIRVRTPSIRERADADKLLLHLFEKERLELKLGPLNLPKHIIQRLAERPWRGNVREMKNAVQRILIDHFFAPDSSLESLQALCPEQCETTEALEKPPTGLRQESLNAERETIQRALTAAGGNVAKAARALGSSRATLYRKIKRHGLLKVRWETA